MGTVPSLSRGRGVRVRGMCAARPGPVRPVPPWAPLGTPSVGVGGPAAPPAGKVPGDGWGASGGIVPPRWWLLPLVLRLPSLGGWGRASHPPPVASRPASRPNRRKRRRLLQHRPGTGLPGPGSGPGPPVPLPVEWGGQGGSVSWPDRVRPTIRSHQPPPQLKPLGPPFPRPPPLRKTYSYT